MAGHMTAAYLASRGHRVTGFARTNSRCCERTILGDAADTALLKGVLIRERFDCVVNCIGVLNRAVDADISRGIYLNSLLPHLIADELRGTGTKLIQISTDCVFSGARGGYTEDDVPDETSLYGRTKALGEVDDSQNLTIRTSIVGPELKESGVGLFHWFMSQRGTVKGFTRTIWSGVTTLELAKAVEWAAEEPLTGLCHLTNGQGISKYDLLCLFNTYCRQDGVLLIPDEEFVCDKSILCTRADVHYPVPPYENMVAELAEWIRARPELYAGYKEFLWKN